MLEDEILKLGFVCGSSRALTRIYSKYVDTLLTLAVALLNDTSLAEDVVHDVFLRFARSSRQFRLRGHLKSFLCTCVVNRARDVIRQRHRRSSESIDEVAPLYTTQDGPLSRVISDELSQLAQQALATLPYEQREVMVLYHQTDLTFAQIAELQGVSMRTIQGRYRYGLAKLRAIFIHEVRA